MATIAISVLLLSGSLPSTARSAATAGTDRPLGATPDKGGEAGTARPSDKPEKAERTDRNEGRDQSETGEKANPPQPPAPGGMVDLAKLRAEYDRIREELFKARVRSQKVAETVYASKLDGELRWKGGPDFIIKKARLLLDGAELWDSGDRTKTDDLIRVSERSVKPGPHALTVRLEVRPRAEAKGGTKTGADRLGYTSEHTFAIVVADAGRTHLLLTGDEDGDPPEYEPELELEIETEK